MVFGPLMWSVWKRTGTSAYRSPAARTARSARWRASPSTASPAPSAALELPQAGLDDDGSAGLEGRGQSVTPRVAVALTARTA